MLSGKLIFQALIFTALLFDVTVSLYAQDDCPLENFINPNKTWTEISYHFTSARTIKYRFDTIPVEREGKIYYELKIQYSQDSEFWHTEALIRNENGRLYTPGYSGSENLMYDFNLVKGDTFHLDDESSFMKFVVVDIDTISIYDGSLRRRWKLNPLIEFPSDTTIWIEGIGNINGFLHNRIPWGADWDPTRLLCLSCQEVLVYDNPDYDSCWVVITSTDDVKESDICVVPNPAKDKISITGIEDPIKSVHVFNAIGSLILVEKELQIRIDNLSHGYYTAVVILTDGRSKTLRFIKL